MAFLSDEKLEELRQRGKVIPQRMAPPEPEEEPEVDLKAESLGALALRNAAVVSVPLDEDKFKVRNLRLILTLADGRVVKAGRKAAFTSHADWSYFEGTAFELDAAAKARRTSPIPLDFE